MQLVAEGDDVATSCPPGADPLQAMSWPSEPLRTMIIRAMAKLGVGRCVCLCACAKGEGLKRGRGKRVRKIVSEVSGWFAVLDSKFVRP